MSFRQQQPRGRNDAPKFMRPMDSSTNNSSSSTTSGNDRGLFQERIGTGGDVNPGTIVNNPYASLSIQQQRTRLPIFKNRNHILYLLEKYQTLIVVGETGCGKSTQIPQYLYETGYANDGKLIAITEPRRVAAVTLASRVAEERMSILGREVGYCVRFDDMTDKERTKIKYMTDGILVREIMKDPLLTNYSVLMVDEAHERTIYSDIILGLLRKILAKRPDLRLIVSSATLEAELFRDFFNLNQSTSEDHSKDTSTCISVEGRMYPVSIYYSIDACPDYLRATVDAVLKIHTDERSTHGDILAFLTGQDEVEAVCQMLRDRAEALVKRRQQCDKLWVLPMYGALPFKEQLKVFDSSPAGTRKVVIATNIAEASVTIPGIVYVIDCGFVKLRALHPNTGIESLMLVPVSRASAEQRAGRAGRLRAGFTYRLYPEQEYEKLRAATVPEIQRSHMAPVILQLKALGIENVLKFHYLSRPPAYSMIRGLELLYALGALDDQGRLTEPLGNRMAEFPLPPMHAKAILCSAEFQCSEEMLTIIAMLQIQDVFSFPQGQKHKAELSKRGFSVEQGDHLTLLNVYNAFERTDRNSKWCRDHYLNYRGLCRAAEIRAQLRRLLVRYKIPLVSCRESLDTVRNIQRCLVAGFFSNAAKLHFTGTYRTLREDYTLKVYAGSAIMYRKEYPKWVIFNEVMQDSMRDITVIDEPDWLYELAPHYYEFGTAGELASKRARLDDDS